MYKIPEYTKTVLTNENIVQGEPIEIKVRRMITEKEPIKEGSNLIYTDRKDGVNAAFNIRTDRWEVAIDAMTLLMKSKQAKRDELMKKEDAKIVDINGKPESIQGKVSEK